MSHDNLKLKHYLCSMNSQADSNIRMSENIIIADADYIDSVAFDCQLRTHDRQAYSKGRFKPMGSLCGT